MRIIAGDAKNFRLKTVKGSHTRPTTDRVKESWFGKLASYDVLKNARVADLYAGTGSLGLEAASRGAAIVEFVDSSLPSVKVIQENIHSVSPALNSEMTVHAVTVEKFLKKTPGFYDLVFLDPPYEMGNKQIYTNLQVLSSKVQSHSILMVERSIRTPVLDFPHQLRCFSHKEYGETVVWWLELE